MSAYAFGKPVIATNVGGLPEMVLHNITGIIVEPKNANQLAEAIIYLFNNPEILNLLSDNIKNIYIEGERSWKKSAGLIQEIFQRKYNKNS
jgi:glycosyltransferase involved in cell wall biosynthesis